MAVFRGVRKNRLFDHVDALTGEQVLASEHYSPVNDASVLTGEKTYSRFYHRVTDKAPPAVCDLRGDYLIFGWRAFGMLMAGIGLLGLGTGVNGLLLATFGTGEAAHWLFDWPGGFFGISLFFICFFGYFRLPFGHFIVFDRRNKLVHLPRRFSHKQDSVRWDDLDFCVIDMLEGYIWGDIQTEIQIVQPRYTLKENGTRPARFRYITLHQDLKGKGPNGWIDVNGKDYTQDGAEAVFRFIVDFMTKPPEFSTTLDAIAYIDVDIESPSMGNNNFELTVRKHKKFWSLIDPERLPTEPNWIKNDQGGWWQIKPAVRARFGWFGLWNRSYTLPPYLRGTKADPACKDNPDAPMPVLRWVPVSQGGTGELVGQPPEVLAAVLRGEGMPSKESLDKTRLAEGGWPGPEHEWWYEQFDKQQPAASKPQPESQADDV